MCGSREISLVPSLHRASTDALISKGRAFTIIVNDVDCCSISDVLSQTLNAREKSRVVWDKCE